MTGARCTTSHFLPSRTNLASNNNIVGQTCFYHHELHSDTRHEHPSGADATDDAEPTVGSFRRTKVHGDADALSVYIEGRTPDATPVVTPRPPDGLVPPDARTTVTFVSDPMPI